MVGGEGGSPGYVSKCNSNDLVSVRAIKIYTDQETHTGSNFINQITIYWSDGTHHRCGGAFTWQAR